MARKISVNIVLAGLLLILGLSNCKRDGNEINYYYGTFPDSVINIQGLNSEFDDYNSAIPQIIGNLPVMFSTNRSSEGGVFDVETGVVTFTFNQIDGSFNLDAEMYSNDFYTAIETKVNNSFDQFGPYRFFNSRTGKEFFFYASGTEDNGLDLKFMEFFPPGPGESPFLGETYDATRLNTISDDAYISIDWDIRNVYLTSDRGGNFDIYTAPIDLSTDLGVWLKGAPEAMVLADSVNSSSDDKCPYIFDEYMIFTSDKPGGFGGFDLYYSRFVNGKWGSPVNFGPRINSQYNEYRPVLGFASGFTNFFMIFSSDRPGGEGGYDLYFTGITFE